LLLLAAALAGALDRAEAGTLTFYAPDGSAVYSVQIAPAGSYRATATPESQPAPQPAPAPGTPPASPAPPQADCPAGVAPAADFPQWSRPGTVMDSAVGAGQSIALPIRNNLNYATGLITFENGNFGAPGSKTVAVSRCPGDFTAQVGANCSSVGIAPVIRFYSQPGYDTIPGGYRLDRAATQCYIEPGKPYYLNIKSSNPIAGAGFVVSVQAQ
jgi:hypothetical protein